MEKEKVFKNFKKMIEMSWTYDKMTEKERQKWIEILNSQQTIDTVKGTYQQRWKILQIMYKCYLERFKL